MKERLEWDVRKWVRMTRFATLVVAVAFAAGAFAFGGMAYFASSRAGDEEARAQDLKHRASEIQKILEDTKSKAEVRVRNQSKSVAEFQENVSTLARQCEVQVDEFIASTDFQPYLSRFSKTTEGQGWSQVEIQLQLKGDAHSVVRAVGGLAEQSVPIEFNSLQLSREALTNNATTVTAKIQLRVLVQTIGELE